MPIGILFWVLMIIWFLFSTWWTYEPGPAGMGRMGGNVLLFVVVALLGWRVFGPVLQ